MLTPSIKTQLLQELQGSLTQSPRTLAMAAPPPAYTPQPFNPQVVAHCEESRAEPDMDATHSPINIKISCPITITGNANLIAIDPARMASDMANSMVQGIRDCSMARMGIPMIDEEGRPRPLDVQVDAGIMVDGRKNAVGKKAMRFSQKATRNLKRHRGQVKGKEERPRNEGNEEEDVGIDMREKKQRVA